MTLTHKHHIIPKHAGGTDAADNLIELTVEEHAEAHRILFEQNGAWQDYIAWKTLSGQIGKEELRREMTRLYWTNNKHSPETIEKIKAARALQAPASVETRAKMSASGKGKKKPAGWNVITPESNEKRSLALKGRPCVEYTCPHCGKVGKSNAMKRWHFDNCKER